MYREVEGGAVLSTGKCGLAASLPSSQRKLGPSAFPRDAGKALDSSVRWNDGEGCGLTARWKVALFCPLGNAGSQQTSRRPSGSWDPAPFHGMRGRRWIPAFAGMTVRDVRLYREVEGDAVRWSKHYWQGAYPHISGYRSRQYGLDASMSSTFHARRHALRAFSRAIADSIVSCSSNQTRMWTRWR